MKILEKVKKAKEFLILGDLENSEKIYLNILEIEPDNYDALMGMGNIKIKNKDFMNSIKFFKKCLYFYKSSIDAYINLSNIYIILNKYEDAINILQLARTIDKKNYILINNLAFVYFNTNKLKDANSIINLGLKNNSENFFLYNIKGNINIRNSKFDLAIECFKKSLEIKEDFWSAYENLFSILEKTNKLDEFNSYLINAKIFFSDDYRFNYYLALYYYRKNDFDYSNHILNKIEVKNIKTNKNLFLIKVYDLYAKNFDKLSNIEKSLKNFTKRNDLKIKLKENLKYDENIVLETIDRYKKYFKKKTNLIFKEKNIITNENPVFLVGFPRSGTTLLDSILRSHSKTIVLEEQPIISSIKDDFLSSNDNLISALDKINEDDVKLIQKKYFQLALKFNRIKDINNKLIIDKFPLNLIEIGFISRIFPESKFILVLRHPCDVVLSCFMTDFKMNEGMINFLKLETSVIFYNKIFNLWKHYTQELNIVYHVIKYEELICDFDNQIMSILNFLDLKWEDEIKNFQRTAQNRIKINTPSYNQVIKPLYKQSIDRWKKYESYVNLYPKLEKWVKYFNYIN